MFTALLPGIFRVFRLLRFFLLGHASLDKRLVDVGHGIQRYKLNLPNGARMCKM